MPFFTTTIERATFLGQLGSEHVPAGCWFRHAIEAPTHLETPEGRTKLYADDEVSKDCVTIAIAEIAGIKNVVLEPANINRQPMFHTFFGVLRTKGLEGLRATIANQIPPTYDPATGQNVVQEIEPVSGPAVQRWATRFAEYMVEIAVKNVAARRVLENRATPLMLAEGLTAAHLHLERLGYGPTVGLDEAMILAIWNAMNAAKGK